MGKDGGHPKSGSQAQSPFLRRAGLYIAIAFELPGTLLGGLVVGYLLDQYFGSWPWLFITLGFVAFIGATLRLVQWAKFFSKRGHDGNGPSDPPAH